MSGVTHFLKQINQDGPHAAEQLLPLVYDELRKLAAARLAGENPGQTLQATALVHEAYLRLMANDGAEPPDGNVQSWDNRGHFFAAAAEAMRRILVESARRKASLKRGGGMQRLPLEALAATESEDADSLLALDEALEKLALADPPAAELVKLRYFAGLTMEEAAEVLEMSPRSAYYTWSYARSWLHQAIS